ncbi:MAG: hypothetical protein ACQESD_00375 [Thermoplasmatota archaeon]
MKDGLISNSIKDIEYSSNNHIIFARSNKGLSIINITKNHIINIESRNGLLSNKINCIDWNEDRSELYIGHDNGISILTIEDNTDLPNIDHTPVTQATVGEPITIEAKITDNSNISSAEVYYRPINQTNFTSIEMQADGNEYTAQIPATPTPGKMEYYIQAMDIHGNENSTDTYEIDVIKKESTTQDKEGFIPGTSQTTSFILLITIAVISTFALIIIKKKKE